MCTKQHTNGISVIFLAGVLLLWLATGDLCSAAEDYTQYVHVVQNANGQNGLHNSALLRYPLGRIGVWSIDPGEVADSVTRGIRLYPCTGDIIAKGEDDWRDSISGNPSQLDVTYKRGTPAQGCRVSLTVRPNVSVYKFSFNADHGAVAIQLGEVEFPSWTHKDWNANSLRIVDSRTMEAVLSGVNGNTVRFYITFNVPSTSRGTIAEKAVSEGADSISGDTVGGFFRFDAPEVVASVAMSHTSMDQAKAYFRNEFADMNFERAVQELRGAWNEKLRRVEITASRHIKEMFYTALYTIYVNIIDASDGSPYTYRPLLTISSSDWWQHLGGFLRCSWDNVRAVYPLLIMIDPDLMTDILNVYQNQYDTDGCFYGNWCPLGGWKWREKNSISRVYLAAYLHGIKGVDYRKACEALKETVENHYPDITAYMTNHYVPYNENGPDANKQSIRFTLEYGYQLHAMALLANALGDSATYNKYIGCSQYYVNCWDAENKVFRPKNSDGSWGAIGKGLYEGSPRDWAFAVPNDPYGLIDLYGRVDAVKRIDDYMQTAWLNDYQLIYQFIPIYANEPSVTEKLSRDVFVPKFRSYIMAEGFSRNNSPWGCYYTSNAGALACTILGLYHIPAPGAQWIFTSPSVEKAIVHGKTKIMIETVNYADKNDYIESIKLNNAPFPSCMISGRSLTSSDVTLTFAMTNQPTRMGRIYLGSADAEVLSASSDGSSYLEFEVDPIGKDCRARVYSGTPPASVLVNGSPIHTWDYDSDKVININNIPKGTVRVTIE
ncbi:MAG: glycoside hydrolase family 92 protein [Phycisphaerales bacterium]|nr:MAG: glycoside hydrolase family 92 protein [Phycisphaerales bacterium]